MKLRLTARERVILALRNQGYRFEHLHIDEKKMTVWLKANGKSMRLRLRTHGVICGNRPRIEAGTYKFFDHFWFRRMPPGMVNQFLGTV